MTTLPALRAPTDSLAPTALTRTGLGVAIQDGHCRVLTFKPIAVGSALLEVHGLVVSAPGRYTLQVAADKHVAPPEGLSLDQEPERYLWRFLNHSCRPNAAFQGLRLFALQDLDVGDEVTFDYHCTEYEIAAAFTCRCGHCEGRLIRGFKHLSPAEQARLAPHLAPHLADLLPPAP
jgi:hypothetical protein